MTQALIDREVLEAAEEALSRWSGIINFQYSGSRDAMSYLQECDNFGQPALNNLAAATEAEPVERKCAECGTPADDGTAMYCAACLLREAKPVEPVAWRWQVVAFANAMEAQLRENDHKGHWDGCGAQWLLARLIGETSELALELHEEQEENGILNEAADVANFAMMLADVSGELHTAPPEHAPQVPLADAGGESTAQQAILDALNRAVGRANELEAELGIERMRVVACGVVACSDTTDSAKSARIMHADYYTPSCADVARRVDECISLRAQLTAANEARQKAEKDAERNLKALLNIRSHCEQAPHVPVTLTINDILHEVSAALAQRKG